MTLGKIRSATRNAPTKQAWLPITLLPVGPKRVNKIPVYTIDTHEIQALQTVHDVLAHMLKPLFTAECQQGYEMVCADGNMRLCFPKLFCCMVDHMENTTIHSIASNRYLTCTIPMEKLGEYLKTPFPTRSHVDYDAVYRKSDVISLRAQGVKNLANALWSVPNVNPPNLVRADILHNILLVVLVHMMDWI